ACPAPGLSARALLRLVERRCQDQMATHPRAPGLEATAVDAPHTVAASALSVLSHSHEVGRLVAPSASELMNLTLRLLPAPRALRSMPAWYVRPSRSHG